MGWIICSLCWYLCGKWDFMHYLNPIVFCFWSVAKCLPNTDCAQQWIKNVPLFLKCYLYRMTDKDTFVSKNMQKMYRMLTVFYHRIQQDCS